MAQFATAPPSTKKSVPPGPRGLPVIGSLLPMQNDRLNFLNKTARMYGEVAALHIGTRTMILLTAPEFIQQVLVAQAEKFQKAVGLRNVGAGLLGDGLLTSEGAFHKHQRKMIQPAFHTSRIAGYADTMIDYTQAVMSRWQDGQIVDMHAQMMDVTRDIIAKLLFDTDMSADGDKIGEAVTTMLKATDRRVSLSRILPKWLMPAATSEEIDSVALVRKLVEDIIAQRRQSGQDTGDVLSMLLSAVDEKGGSMDDQQVFEEAMTLFLAGHETTANATAWTWYLLSQNPDAAVKLQAELDRVLGRRRPTVADLGQLPYLDGVIKESMRIYPPAWTVGVRQALTDVEIGGYRFSKGTLFIMPIYVLHRDPKFFPNPEQFKPERWANDYQKQLPRYVYYPFGAGVRVCIGQPLAEMEARLIVAAIAQKWTTDLVPGQEIKPIPMVTLRPSTLQMILHARG